MFSASINEIVTGFQVGNYIPDTNTYPYGNSQHILLSLQLREVWSRKISKYFNLCFQKRTYDIPWNTLLSEFRFFFFFFWYL